MNKKDELLKLIQDLQLDLRQRKVGTLNTTLIISELRNLIREKEGSVTGI
tara:strand:- start:5500 stop:5649 length:150 start_codon:yes stop_codon:yes gene_type:complete